MGCGVFGDTPDPKYVDLTSMMKSKYEIEVKEVLVGGRFMTIKDTQG